MRTNLRKWLLAGGFILLALAGILATKSPGFALFAAPAPDLFSMMPSGAPTLAFFDLIAIRNSAIYKNRTDHSPITVPNADYKNFMAETGFDFEHDLDRAAIAVWPKLPTETQAKAVVVAEGRFDRAKIRAYAMKNGKTVQQMSREVFLFPPSSTTARTNSWSALTFLDDHHVGIVGGMDIEPLLAGHRIDATDPIHEQIARVQDSAAFLIVHASAFPTSSAMNGTPAAQFAGLAKTLDWVSLAMGSDGDNARVSLEGECKTSADADQLHSAMEFLRQLGLATLSNQKPNPQMNPEMFAALKTLVAGIEIKETDNRVRVLMELTPDMINQFGSAKKAGASGAN